MKYRTPLIIFITAILSSAATTGVLHFWPSSKPAPGMPPAPGPKIQSCADAERPAPTSLLRSYAGQNFGEEKSCTVKTGGQGEREERIYTVELARGARWTLSFLVPEIMEEALEVPAGALTVEAAQETLRDALQEGNLHATVNWEAPSPSEENGQLTRNYYADQDDGMNVRAFVVLKNDQIIKMGWSYAL